MGELTRDSIRLFSIPSSLYEIVNINDVFVMTDQQLQTYFGSLSISIATFMAAQSMYELEIIFAAARVSVKTEYEAVWYLMSMETSERKDFLKRTGRRVIENKDAVRNVSQLIAWVKKYEPTMPHTFQGYANVPPMQIGLFLMDPDSDVVLREMKKEIKKESKLGGVLAFLESRKIRYLITPRYFWKILSVFPLPMRTAKQVGNLDMSVKVKNIEDYLNWLKIQQPKSLEKLYNQSVCQKLKLKREIIKDGSIRIVPQKFGSLDQLFVMDETMRKKILGELALDVESFSSLRSLTDLETIFDYFSVEYSESSEFFQTFWSLLTASKEEKYKFLQKYDSVLEISNIAAINNVADLLNLINRNMPNIDRFFKECGEGRHRDIMKGYDARYARKLLNNVKDEVETAMLNSRGNKASVDINGNSQVVSELNNNQPGEPAGKPETFTEKLAKDSETPLAMEPVNELKSPAAKELSQEANVSTEVRKNLETPRDPLRPAVKSRNKTKKPEESDRSPAMEAGKEPNVPTQKSDEKFQVLAKKINKESSTSANEPGEVPKVLANTARKESKAQSKEAGRKVSTKELAKGTKASLEETVEAPETSTKALKKVAKKPKA